MGQLPIQLPIIPQVRRAGWRDGRCWPVFAPLQKDELASAVYAAAWERGKALELEAVAARLFKKANA